MEKGILLYGYGNPGRQDDGLGNAFIEEMEKWKQANHFDWLFLDSNYQLNIEDSEALTGKELVIFIDASVENIESFCLTKVEPSESRVEFTMHAVSPAFVLDLCMKVFNEAPPAYLLHIKGYEWDFKEGLTKKSRGNLFKALEFMKGVLSEVDPEEIHALLEKSVSEYIC